MDLEEIIMDIKVGNNILRIRLKRLGNSIDNYLELLFASFFADTSKTFSLFINEHDQELVSNIYSYLDEKISDPPGQDFLFNNLSIIWNYYQSSGRVSEAQQFWNYILNIILNWEISRKKRIHKGSIFFFWSQTAILQGELDKGFFLIHSAFEEDILTLNTQQPDSPSFKTVSMRFDDDKNLLIGLIKEWANYLDGFLDNYRNTSGNKLTLVDFQKKFLDHPPSRDSLFSFTYTLARLFQFDKIPSVAIQGNFASLFELNILFDLVLVIDTKIFSSILNPKRNDWKFINLADILLTKSAISNNLQPNLTHLMEINSSKDTDFEGTMNALLDQKFTYTDGISLSQQECDVAISYCLRNHSAHNINSFPVIRDRFNEIRQSIFNVLFLAVEFL